MKKRTLSSHIGEFIGYCILISLAFLGLSAVVYSFKFFLSFIV